MQEQSHISITRAEADFDACASMMATSDPWMTLGFDVFACRNAFIGDERETHVLRLGSAIIGFVIIQPKGSFKGYIQTLCIHEKHRGQGWGKRLLDYAEETIHLYSPNVFICVSDFNKEALALYRKFGFSEVGPLPDFVKKGFTEILMRKSTGPIADYKTPLI